jgi:hypothetical protein
MTTTITGNTYPHRYLIKSYGFKWNPKFKSWDKNGNLSQEQIDALNGLKGLEVRYHNFDTGWTSTVADTRSHKQIYGRCEDAPCCGCCGPQFY